MPLINNNSQEFPDWSELDFYKIEWIDAGGVIERAIKSEKEIVFICEGKVRTYLDGNSTDYKKGDVIDLLSSDNTIKFYGIQDSVLIIVGGYWSEPRGDCGIFSLQNAELPENVGDPVEFTHLTDLDYHYHDCDEYWIIYKGSGKAVSEGRTYEIGPGDCVATKMGDHHTMPEVYDELHGIYFETTLKGMKRKGHLWNHTHK